MTCGLFVQQSRNCDPSMVPSARSRPAEYDCGFGVTSVGAGAHQSVSGLRGQYMPMNMHISSVVCWPCATLRLSWFV